LTQDKNALRRRNLPRLYLHRLLDWSQQQRLLQTGGHT
jgi:hypothetical protein